jgi:Ca2+-binding RTX toxin-like protein
MRIPALHLRTRLFAVCLAMATAALAPAAAVAAAPANDNFADAQTATDGDTSPTHGTNVDATKEPGEPEHENNPGGASVWYRWTAPDSRYVIVDTCESDFFTLLGVYTGDSVSGLGSAASGYFSCPDIPGFNPLGSVVELKTQAGTVYRIAVDGGRDPDTDEVDMGTFELFIVGESRCDDGHDNDGDGKVDGNDQGCSGPTDDDETDVVVQPPPAKQCADGKDNDGDTRVDMADPGCSSSTDDDETNPENEVLTGTAGNDVICGLGGSDVIRGLGGNDTLFGDACGSPAASHNATAAADGNDKLYGGPGKDRLYGGGGGDTLDGGGGQDRIAGGGGRDRINAKDGARDRVDCGAGKDRVRADRKDRLRHCERVRR